MTVGDGPSADAGVEGKAPGVVFTLELGDVWVLLVVAMVMNGVTLASSYTCATSWVYSIAPWARLSRNQPTPVESDNEDRNTNAIALVLCLNEYMTRCGDCAAIEDCVSILDKIVTAISRPRYIVAGGLRPGAAAHRAFQGPAAALATSRA